jgi:hypothetical protein
VVTDRSCVKMFCILKSYYSKNKIINVNSAKIFPSAFVVMATIIERLELIIWKFTLKNLKIGSSKHVSRSKFYVVSGNISMRNLHFTNEFEINETNNICYRNESFMTSTRNTFTYCLRFWNLQLSPTVIPLQALLITFTFR